MDQNHVIVPLWSGPICARKQFACFQTRSIAVSNRVSDYERGKRMGYERGSPVTLQLPHSILTELVCPGPARFLRANSEMRMNERYLTRSECRDTRQSHGDGNQSWKMKASDETLFQRMRGGLKIRSEAGTIFRHMATLRPFLTSTRKSQE